MCESRGFRWRFLAVRPNIQSVDGHAVSDFDPPRRVLGANSEGPGSSFVPIGGAMRDTAVVVPCYNEAERLDVGAFREFARSHTDVFFLFVNDGSTDRTQELLEDLHHHDPDAF